MNKNRGRPRKEKTKSVYIPIRLSKDETEDLDYLAYMSDMSRSEVMRKALKMMYNLEKYKLED